MCGTHIASLPAPPTRTIESDNGRGVTFQYAAGRDGYHGCLTAMGPIVAGAAGDPLEGAIVKGEHDENFRS